MIAYWREVQAVIVGIRVWQEGVFEKRTDTNTITRTRVHKVI